MKKKYVCKANYIPINKEIKNMNKKGLIGNEETEEVTDILFKHLL